MEHVLTCNNLQCRKELRDRALVTTCSHIFCLDCAHRLGVDLDQISPSQTQCPACHSQLPNANDAIITNLHPTEDYKTSLLSGLSPNIIMECAGRALSFWAYQTTQDIYYQQHLYKALGEKFSQLNVRFEKMVHEANTEIDCLQQRIRGLTAEYETLRRKNDELAQAYREKGRRLLQTQELYDKAKRKSEIGHIQLAASNAVESALRVSRGGTEGYPGCHGMENQLSSPTAISSQRHDATGMNVSAQRSTMSPLSERNRWIRNGLSSGGEFNPRPATVSWKTWLTFEASAQALNTPHTSCQGQHQSVEAPPVAVGSLHHLAESSRHNRTFNTTTRAPLARHSPLSGRVSSLGHSPSFGLARFSRQRAGPTDIGLTSGLKTSHSPQHGGVNGTVIGP